MASMKNMWSKKVLVAYDGSPASHKALDIAQDIAASDPDIEFVLVHALLLYSSGAGGVGMDSVLLSDAEHIEEELSEIATLMPNNVTVEVLKGTSPADLILNCAKEQDCDLIIMGNRGKGGVRGYLGSVSYRVIKESPVTVMIAKES